MVAAAPVPHPCMHSSMGTHGGNPAVQTNYTPVTVNHTAMHGDLIAGRGRTSTGSFPTKNAHCLRQCLRHRGGTKEGLYLYSLKSIVSLFLTPKGWRTCEELRLEKVMTASRFGLLEETGGNWNGMVEELERREISQWKDERQGWQCNRSLNEIRDQRLQLSVEVSAVIWEFRSLGN